MSKKNKAAAKLKAQRLLPSRALSKLPTPLADSADHSDPDLIAPEDLIITEDILSLLASQPTLLSQKQLKPLKRTLWDLSKYLTGDPAASLHSRISIALAQSLYKEALVLLFELYVNKVPTKLGSLQRWVRECDATAKPAEIKGKGKEKEIEEEREGREDVLKCLDLVLRVCASDTLKERKVKDGWDEVLEWDGAIQKMKIWKVRDGDLDRPLQAEVPLWDLIQEGFTTPPPGAPSTSSLYKLQTTPGALRRPPNLHPSTVWASLLSNPTIHLSPSSLPPFSVPHPIIPHCSMLCNILPASTCSEIIRMANAVGWEEDQAVGGSAVDKTSVLAHNVVWLADEEFNKCLFDRIKPFVPETLGEDGTGGRVRGINRRFRIYRYGPRQVYRPHIDGAWPAAGVDAKTGEYLHDSSPADDPLWSRYTLLIYLNSDINPSLPPTTTIPGATTFFLPSPTSLGTLQSYPIAPIQGSVVVFPHGDARGSLLHEGSPVGDGGWKVVIRTDLLYEAEGFGEFAKGKRKRMEMEQEQEEEDGAAGKGPSKVVKLAGGVGEAVVPRSLGERNGGEGREGIGG